MSAHSRWPPGPRRRPEGPSAQHRGTASVTAPLPQKKGGQERARGALRGAALPSRPPAALTVLAVGAADARRAAAGPRPGVAGPAVLAAAGGAAVLPEGVQRAGCRDRAPRSRPQQGRPRAPPGTLWSPPGFEPPVQKQPPRTTRMTLVPLTSTRRAEVPGRGHVPSPASTFPSGALSWQMPGRHQGRDHTPRAARSGVVGRGGVQAPDRGGRAGVQRAPATSRLWPGDLLPHRHGRRGKRLAQGGWSVTLNT